MLLQEIEILKSECIRVFCLQRDGINPRDMAIHNVLYCHILQYNNVYHKTIVTFTSWYRQEFASRLQPESAHKSLICYRLTFPHLLVKSWLRHAIFLNVLPSPFFVSQRSIHVFYSCLMSSMLMWSSSIQTRHKNSISEACI